MIVIKILVLVLSVVMGTVIVSRGHWYVHKDHEYEEFMYGKTCNTIFIVFAAIAEFLGIIIGIAGFVYLFL